MKKTNEKIVKKNRKDIDQKDFDNFHGFIFIQVIEFCSKIKSESAVNLYFSIAKALLCMSTLDACGDLKTEEEIEYAQQQYHIRLDRIRGKIDFSFNALLMDLEKNGKIDFKGERIFRDYLSIL